MSIQEIEIEALKLDLRSRAQLAEKLLQSLDSPSDEETEQLWAEEAFRRYEEMESGKVKGKPAEDVHREARSAIK